jgi:hypothetical protein
MTRGPHPQSWSHAAHSRQAACTSHYEPNGSSGKATYSTPSIARSSLLSSHNCQRDSWLYLCRRMNSPRHTSNLRQRSTNGHCQRIQQRCSTSDSNHCCVASTSIIKQCLIRHQIRLLENLRSGLPAIELVRTSPPTGPSLCFVWTTFHPEQQHDKMTHHRELPNTRSEDQPHESFFKVEVHHRLNRGIRHGLGPAPSRRNRRRSRTTPATKPWSHWAKRTTPSALSSSANALGHSSDATLVVDLGHSIAAVNFGQPSDIIAVALGHLATPFSSSTWVIPTAPQSQPDSSRHRSRCPGSHKRRQFRRRPGPLQRSLHSRRSGSFKRRQLRRRPGTQQ